MQNYILSFDPLNSRVTMQQLAVFIRVSREIHGWHTPFVGTYMLKSNESLFALQQSFNELFETESFIITMADPGRVTGFLPVSIWEWFNSGVNALLNAVTQYTSPPPPPSL